jgi:hypothetical protein
LTYDGICLLLDLRSLTICTSIGLFGLVFLEKQTGGQLIKSVRSYSMQKPYIGGPVSTCGRWSLYYVQTFLYLNKQSWHPKFTHDLSYIAGRSKDALPQEFLPTQLRLLGMDLLQSFLSSIHVLRWSCSHGTKSMNSTSCSSAIKNIMPNFTSCNPLLNETGTSEASTSAGGARPLGLGFGVWGFYLLINQITCDIRSLITCFIEVFSCVSLEWGMWWWKEADYSGGFISKATCATAKLSAELHLMCAIRITRGLQFKEQWQNLNTMGLQYLILHNQ